MTENADRLGRNAGLRDSSVKSMEAAATHLWDRYAARHGLCVFPVDPLDLAVGMHAALDAGASPAYGRVAVQGVRHRHVVALGGDDEAKAAASMVVSLAARVIRSVDRQIRGSVAQAPVFPYLWFEDRVDRLIRDGRYADAALLTVLYGGMLRPSEPGEILIENLRPFGDGMLLNPTVTKTAYGTHRQHLAIGHGSSTVLDPIVAIERHLHHLGNPDRGPLFPGATGEPITYEQVVAVVRDCLHPGLSGHSLRRSGATHLNAVGTPVPEIMDRLRHTMEATTARYLEPLRAWAGGDGKAVILGDGTGWTLPTTRRSKADLRGWWDRTDPVEETRGTVLALLDHFGGRYAAQTVGSYAHYRNSWQAFAEDHGFDPDRPAPHGPAMWIQEVAETLSPNTLTIPVAALEAHLTTIDSLGFRYAALAREQVEGIQADFARNGGLHDDDDRDPARKGRPRGLTDPGTEEDIAVLLDTPSWSNRLAGLARLILIRAVGSTDKFQTLTGADATVDDTTVPVTVTLRVGGRTIVLMEDPDPFQDPVWAARYLQHHRPDKAWLTKAERNKMRNSLGMYPEKMTPDVFERVARDDAHHLFAWFRFRVQGSLGYTGALGTTDLLDLEWEHLRLDADGYVKAAVRGRTVSFVPVPGILDPARALRDLASVWPWPGNGLHGCHGPISAATREGKGFPGQPTRMHDHSLYASYEQAAQGAGFGPLNPSVLRVSAGVHEYDRTGRVEAVQNLLGHTTSAKTRAFLNARGLALVHLQITNATPPPTEPPHDQ